ncbi:MAG: transcriptional regulator [Thermomicrobiales bacterium]|nr:MAG: transcriptional regulator [Thermomicrobiales bacterium]
MTTSTRPDECCVTPLVPVPMSAGVRDALVAGFKALADPSRFEIFRLIAAQPEPLCACDVVARFDLSQPTISHHLKVLRDAGLITSTRRGVWAYYAIAPAGVRLLQWGLGATLEEGVRRPG